MIKTYYKYYMTIDDKEWNDIYDFDGYFETVEEFARFLQENADVGNVITMRAPFVEMVQMREKDLPTR